MADPGVDPLTTEIVRNALAVAVEEASIVVVRSSHSTFIQEGADACAALLDPDGELVAQSMATSLIHGASLRSSLPSLVEDVPLDSMLPGDVFAMNDPYRGGIHANDVLVFRPIFANGGSGHGAGGGRRVVLFAGTLIHVADVGGAVAGGLAALAADTFAEGLLLPPVRLYAAGQPVDDVARIVARNSRAPRQVMGDIQALVAGTSVATAQVGSIVAQHGIQTVERCIHDHLQGTEAAMRRELARLPEGTYHGRFTIDGDGVDDGRSLDVVVAATLAGGEITLDFTGTSAQSRGAINASQSQTLSGVLFAVRCFVDHDLAMNEGCFRPVQVILPEGSVVDPRPPAACGGRVVTVAAVIEAIVEALSQAVPERAVASSGLVHVVTLAGRVGGGDGGQPWLTMLYEFGGIGARRGSDGPDATGAFFLGGRSTISQVEPLEAQHPLRVRHLRLRPESGGAGQWTGGRGVELAVETLTPAVVTVRGDRMRLPPPGRDGGEPGTAGFHAVERHGGAREELAPKQTGVALDAGDVLVVATSGGGGLGPAHDRALTAAGVEPAESVVSVESAP